MRLSPPVPIIVICGLFLAFPALSDDELKTIEITPFIGYRAGGEFESADDGSTLKLDETTSYGIILNMMQTPGGYYEVTYSKQDTRIRGSTPLDLSLEYFHFGGTVTYVEPDARIIPYFVLTIGASRFSPEPAGMSAETDLSFAFGGGLKIPLTSSLAIRLEARAYATMVDSDSTIFCVSSGAAATCNIRIKGDTFIQVQGLAGLTLRF